MKIKPSTTTNEVFVQIILAALKNIKKWQPVAIAGNNPEGVHQVRISLRKMRTAYTLFKSIIHCKQTTASTALLKKFSKALDDARDWDVYLAANYGPSKKSALHILAQQQRQQAYRKVKKLLESKSFKHGLKQLKKSLTENKWLRELSKKQRQRLDSPVRPFANEILETVRQQLLSAHCDTATTDEDLHRLRIGFKELRYATEFFSSLYVSDDIKVFLSHIKQLQDNLGVIHDYAVVKKLHKKILTTPYPDPIILEEITRVELGLIALSQTLKPELYDNYLLFCFHLAPWKSPLTSNKQI